MCAAVYLNCYLIFSDLSGQTSLFDVTTFKQIVEMINNLSKSVRACIKGINHYGRCYAYSEKMFCNEKENDMPTNKNNYLWENWFQSDQYSSWSKIETDLYGQLNYFFKPPIKNDRFVSSLYIASVTCRRVHIPKTLDPAR